MKPASLQMHSSAAGSAMRSYAICAQADWRGSTVQASGLVAKAPARFLAPTLAV
jgi:hypothetical protein